MPKHSKNNEDRRILMSFSFLLSSKDDSKAKPNFNRAAELIRAINSINAFLWYDENLEKHGCSLMLQYSSASLSYASLLIRAKNKKPTNSMFLNIKISSIQHLIDILKKIDDIIAKESPVLELEGSFTVINPRLYDGIRDTIIVYTYKNHELTSEPIGWITRLDVETAKKITKVYHDSL